MADTTEVVKIVLASSGFFSLLGVGITVYFSNRKGKTETDIALRKLENEEEIERRKREKELRDREDKFHADQIEELQKRLKEAEAERDRIKDELEKARASPPLRHHTVQATPSVPHNQVKARLGNVASDYDMDPDDRPQEEP